MPVICDYAHHPTEIKALIESTYEQGKNPLIIFQPHTYSRTQSLIGDFVSALSTCSLCNKKSTVIVYKTFSAREKYNSAGSGYTLHKNLVKTGVNSFYENTPCRLFDRVKTLLKCLQEHSNSYDCVLVVGAGDIYNIFKKTVSEHQKNK